MRIYPVLTLEEQFRLSTLPCSRREEITTIYSEDGVFDLDTKIRKRLIEDCEPVVVELEGRRFKVDSSRFTAVEVWQIPVPNVRETRTLDYYATDTAGGYLVAEHTKDGVHYYFVGETLETVVAQMRFLFATDLHK